MPHSDKDATEDQEEIIMMREEPFFGQLSQQSYSCLMMDAGEEAARQLGPAATEFYYRTMQELDAWATTFGGEGERVITNIYDERYVALCLQELTLIFDKTVAISVDPTMGV